MIETSSAVAGDTRSVDVAGTLLYTAADARHKAYLEDSTFVEALVEPSSDVVVESGIGMMETKLDMAPALEMFRFDAPLGVQPSSLASLRTLQGSDRYH